MTQPSRLSRAAELALIAVLFLGIVIAFQWVSRNQATSTPIETPQSAALLQTETPLAPPTETMPAAYPYPPPATPIPVTPMTPTPAPTETQSPAVQIAFAYVSEHYHIPVDQVFLSQTYLKDYPYQGRRFQVVSMWSKRSGGESYLLFVDVDTGEVIENFVTIGWAEATAMQQKFGKFDQELYPRLQTMQDTDKVYVSIAMAGIDWPHLGVGEMEVGAMATVSAKYPEAQAAIEAGNMPMEVANPTLAAQIATDYYDAMDAIGAAQDQTLEPFRAAEKEALKRLADELKAQGIILNPESSEQLLTKREILLIAQREDVYRISFSGSWPFVRPSP